MTRHDGFPPVATRAARVLILGSMPGRRSLEAEQYYALPQNSFWRVMEALFGTPAQASYTRRLRQLRDHGVALWDVLRSCERSGSLDSAIIDATAVANDFGAFFAHHPQIERVFFNGGKAAEVYRRRVLPIVREAHPKLRYTRLPSTSPAYAAMTHGEKVARWRQVEAALHDGRA